MKRLRDLTAGLSVLLLGWLLPQAHGQQPVRPATPPVAQQWVRLLRGEHDRPQALQTAVVRYSSAPADGSEPVTVDLISAIHVGDRSYYEQLNKLFTQYDALLYELVAPEGTKIRGGEQHRSGHPVGALQHGMKEMLDLEHQLEQIDYSKKNFVHADMTPKQFAATMERRGEGFFQMFLKLMGQGIAQQSRQQAQGKSGDFDLLAALLDPNRAQKLKVVMAEQLESMQWMLAGFGGPEGSTIITERNRIALEELTRQLKAGRRKVGIFYGGGHMTDMDKKLREQFAMQPGPVQWITAWDLRAK